MNQKKNISDRKKREKELLLHSTRQLYGAILPNTYEQTEDAKDLEFTALAQILEYYGMDVPEKPVHLGNESEIDYVLRHTGLLMRRIHLEKGWQSQAAVPLLVTDANGKEFALLPAKNGYYCKWKDGKRKALTKEEINEISHHAYCFYRSFPAEEQGMKSFWKFLFTSVSRADIALICGISILLELCGLIMPYINSVVYNRIIPSGTARQIPGIIVLVISTVVFSALIGLLRSLSVNRLGAKMQIAGQTAVWNRLFQLPTTFFKQYDSGETYNRANAVNQICEIIGGGLIPTALTALLSVVYLIQIFWFASALVVPSILIIVLLLTNIFIASFLQIKLGEKKNQVNNEVTSILYQLINGMTKIRVAGAEVRAYRVWSDSWKNTPLTGPLYLQISGVVGGMISLVGSAVLYTIAWNSHLSASDYIAFQTAYASFLVAVMALASFGFQIGAMRPAIHMLKPILEEKPELYGDREHVDALTGEIELNNVEFRYTKEMPLVLDQLSLHIRAGEYIGIVGSSGCGKSTLMRLLLGFETPQTGGIYFDGKDLTNLDLPSLRRRIGVVLQNGSLFAGDIFSNISICAPLLTMDEAWDAARRAGFAEDIEQMPMGMYTMLSEDGGGISGGQKQRLLIARAIAANPDILLFDEATSALDNKTQATVVQTLKEMDCTRLVIAHRISTIMDCDRIIYLDHGHIVEEGTYQELMEKNGRFAQLAARQLA